MPVSDGFEYISFVAIIETFDNYYKVLSKEHKKQSAGVSLLFGGTGIPLERISEPTPLGVSYSTYRLVPKENYQFSKQDSVSNSFKLFMKYHKIIY